MNKTGCAAFDRWCELNGREPMRAPPATVAQFVSDISHMGIKQVWEHVREISRAHYLIGLADPTLGGPVSAALNVIAKIEPPRAWPKEHKFRFHQLPYDLQVYVAAHEAQRETAIRRLQNESAQARQELKALQPKEKTRWQ